MATFTLIVTVLFTTAYQYPNYTFVTVPGFRSEASCWAGARQFKHTHDQLRMHFSCQKVD
jgi:hypothetical protein